MTAEYYAANQACKNIQYLSQILHQLRWPSSTPVPLLMDSQTAINLVRAPEVSVKSRHIEQKHQSIRSLESAGKIATIHLTAPDMRADVYTKILPKTKFLACVYNVMNRVAFDQCNGV